MYKEGMWVNDQATRTRVTEKGPARRRTLMVMGQVLTLHPRQAVKKRKGFSAPQRVLPWEAESLNSLLLSTKNSSAAMEVVAGVAELAPGQGRRGCTVWPA